MPNARWTDPTTSKNAAASVQPEGITDAQARLLVLLARYGPQTDEDLAHNYERSITLLGWPLASPSGLRTRRSELADAGHVVADDLVTGRTRSGRTATVWRLPRQPECLP